MLRILILLIFLGAPNLFGKKICAQFNSLKTNNIVHQQLRQMTGLRIDADNFTKNPPIAYDLNQCATSQASNDDDDDDDSSRCRPFKVVGLSQNSQLQSLSTSGGKLYLEFDLPVNLDSIGLIEVDNLPDQVKLLDARGNQIGSTKNTGTRANNKKTTFNFDQPNVKKVQVNMNKLGAIWKICINQ